MYSDNTENLFNLPNGNENMTNDDGEKSYELQTYTDYLNEKEPNKKVKKIKPKEDGDLLKIIKYESNKSKIKQRPLATQGVIPKHGFRLLLVGRSGSGKSMCMLNLLQRGHFYGPTDPKNKKSGYFDMIWLFSPSADGGDDLADYLELDDKRVFTNEREFAPVLKHILTTQKAIIESKGLVKAPKICLIFDDCQSCEKFLKSEDFIKIFIAGRHYSISVICCGQSFTKFSRVCRLNASSIMLFPSSNSEIELLTEEYCPPRTTKKAFRELVHHATAENYSFLHINNQVEISKRYRKGLGVILTVNE
tara:strand:- start:256 stop:1173 length:918 start_codon:yes stop_codon:yes gene_type:complete